MAMQQQQSDHNQQQSNEYKLADYFAVIGLDEELTPLDTAGGLSDDLMIEKVEIVYKADPDLMIPYNRQTEKWIDLDGTNQIFLRILYGESRPITDINFYRIKHTKDQPDKMTIPEAMGIEPVPIKIYGEPDSEKRFKKTRKLNPEGDKKKDMICFYGCFDLTPYLESAQQQMQLSNGGTNLCFCYSRKKKNPPISDVEIVQGTAGRSGNPEDVEFNLPQNMKQVNYRLGKTTKNRLLCIKQRQFLKKRFRCRVLDRYPPPSKDRIYYPFPGDSISQFCFPSGIQFTSERTVPTQFSFILTEASGQRVYGTALIFDESLSTETKNQIKNKGKVFNVNLDTIYSQKAICILSHYSFLDSFKELLKQLYRIHLSHTPIPIERYIVNVMDEIPVPDRQGQIQVLHEIGNIQVPFNRSLDQYPPVASRADIEYLFRALNAEQVIDIFLALLLEKKVLLISKYKALLTHASIALISFLFPLCWKHVLIPILPKDMTDVLDAPVPFLIGIDPMIIKEEDQNGGQSFEIPNEVYRVDLDMGFISLRDTKPKLPSKDIKTLKTRLQKATEGIERPSPLLEQVEQAFNVVSYQDELNDQMDGELDEDGNPIRQFRFNEFEIRDAFLEFMTSIMSGYTKCLNAPDSSKEVFLDSRDFFDFKKFRMAKDALKNTTLVFKLTETTLFANFIEARSFGKSDQDEQIMFFDDICKAKRTKKQPQLVGPFREQKTVKSMAPSEDGLELEVVGGSEQPKIYKYQTFPKFDMSLFYVPRRIESYNNEEAAGMHLKSLINNDQLSKMNDAEWARYLAEIIYILWFQIFTTTLPMYPNHAKELVNFCKRLLANINKKLHPMRDIEIIYRRLFEACGTCRLPEEILDLFNDMKHNKIDPDKVTFGTYYQAFQVSKKPPPTQVNVNSNNAGPFQTSQNPNQESQMIPGVLQKESYLKHSAEDFQRKLLEIEKLQKLEEEKINYQKAPLIIGNRFSSGSINGAESEFGLGDNVETQVLTSSRASCQKLSQILENSLYLEIENLCQNEECKKLLKEEEILSSFSKNLSAYIIKCPVCQQNYVPKFGVYSEHKNDYVKGRDGMRIQLLSPVSLYKEYINIVEHKGEQVVLKETFLKDHQTVFWNIVLYFKVMRLPIFMLDLDYSHQRISAHVTTIKRYLPLEKPNGKGSLISGLIPPKQPSQNKVEQSPARKSSIGRLTSQMLDAVLGNSSMKNQKGAAARETSLGRGDSSHNMEKDIQTLTKQGSEKGDRDSLNRVTVLDQATLRDNDSVHQAEKKSATGSFFGRRPPSSHKSNNSGGGGKGPQSVITSLSDLERIERIMNQAQYANKSVVKYFSKHLEEFRREQAQSRELVLSEMMQQPAIPEAMNKHIQSHQHIVQQKQANPLTKNFMEWNKNAQVLKAESIINNDGSNPFNMVAKGNTGQVQRVSITSTQSGVSPGTAEIPQQHPPKIGTTGKQGSSGSLVSSVWSALGLGGGGNGAGRGDSATRKTETQVQKQHPQPSPNTSITLSKPPRDVPQSQRVLASHNQGVGASQGGGAGLSQLLSPQKPILGSVNPISMQPLGQQLPPPKFGAGGGTAKKH